MPRLAVVLVALVAAAAVASADDSQRVKRQYHRPSASKKPANPWEAASRADESVIQYDASGIGFQINNPASFQSFHLGPFHHEPIKPFAFPELKPAYRPDPKPQVYKPEPPKYKPEVPKPAPQYHEPYHPKPEPPKYKPEVPKPVPAYHEPYHPKAEPYPSKYPAYEYYCPKIGGLESECRLAKDCAIWFDLVLATPGTACKLPDGTPGACCPGLPYNGTKSVSPLRRVLRSAI